MRPSGIGSPQHTQYSSFKNIFCLPYCKIDTANICDLVRRAIHAEVLRKDHIGLGCDGRFLIADKLIEENSAVLNLIADCNRNDALRR